MINDKIEYCGERTTKALEKYCMTMSKDCYVVYWYSFGSMFVHRSTTELTSVLAPSDYFHGYFHNGKHYGWSEKRKIAAKNALLTNN